MMKKILLATTSQHKIDEFKAILGNYLTKITLISLKDLGHEQDDAPETSDTFSGNALQKARYYATKYQMPVLCDDSGLEVLGLNKFPGINSKRWLQTRGFKTKINKLLTMLGPKNNDCQYVCAIAYLDQNQAKVFTSKVSGQLVKPVGEDGFGFDIGFYVPKYHQTFSQLDPTIKNHISHRAKAFKKFIIWFESNF